RLDDAAEADDEATDRGPPHPMNRNLREEILERINAEREERGESAGEEAARDARADRRQRHERQVRGHRKERPGTEQMAAKERRGDARERDRDQAARFPLEQEELHGEERARDRRRERRGHARGGARDEQRLSLGRREPEELRDHRAERAAGHDDRSLGAERSAG